MSLSCKSQCNSGANWHVTHPRKVTCKSFPQWQGHRDIIRTVADGCRRLRTRKRRQANTALPSDSQVKREPFATHSGKTLLVQRAIFTLNGTEWESVHFFHSAAIFIYFQKRETSCTKRTLYKGFWVVLGENLPGLPWSTHHPLVLVDWGLRSFLFLKLWWWRRILEDLFPLLKRSGRSN